jgi:hypothetical protein
MSRKGCFRHEASTQKAWRFYPPETPAHGFWVPRSVCTHRSQLEPLAAHLHPLTQITVEEWWCKSHPELDKYFS